jgi:hypothetical protein
MGSNFAKTKQKNKPERVKKEFLKFNFAAWEM